MNNVLAKIVFALICILLIAFFGLGGYFCYSGVIGAGCIGIGLAFVGFGVSGILMDGVLFNKNRKPSKKVVSSSKTSTSNQAHSSMSVMLTGAVHCDSGGKVRDSLAAGLNATEDNITIETLFPTKATIRYSDINSIVRDTDRIRMSCSFEVDGKQKAGSFTIKPQSPIKAKAFEQFVKQKMEKVAV